MLLADVKANGDFLLSELHKLAHRYGNVISEVRGAGYLIGVEFDVNRANFERHFGSFMGIAGEQDSLVLLLASHMLNVGRVRVAPTLNGHRCMAWRRARRPGRCVDGRSGRL